MENYEYNKFIGKTNVKKPYDFYAKFPEYTKEEIKELFDEYFKTHDIETKNKLIEANMKLVVYCARNIAKGLNEYDYDDLISAGFEHLGQIIDRYDPSYGEFSTFAHESLNGYMLSELKRIKNQVYLPDHVNTDLIKIKKVINSYEETYGKEPTPEEISNSSGLPLKKVNKLLNVMNHPEEFNNLDFMGSDPIETIFHQYTIDEIIDFINKYLYPTDRKVIKLRYGLDGGEPKTLEDIGKEINLSRERVRQIHERAMERLTNKFLNDINIKSNNVSSISDIESIDKNSLINEKEYEGYTDSIRDYEGYTEEEYEQKGLGYK